LNFKEFDRCLHSWSVLNGRGYLKYATKQKFRVRVCRFGKTLRSSTQVENLASKGINIPCKGQLFAEFDTIDDGETSESHSESEVDVTNNPCKVSDYFLGKENCQEQVKQARLSLTITERPPLMTLNRENAFVSSEQLQGRSNQIESSKKGKKRPISIVKHHRDWLPKAKSGKTGKKIPQGGFCGELMRVPDRDESGSAEDSIACPFRVRAGIEKSSGKIVITVCDLGHNCPLYKHKWRGPCTNSFWLGETLAPRVVRNVKVPVKEVLLGFQQDYKRNANYKQVWRAKDHIRDWYLGGQKKSFYMMPALLETIQAVDDRAFVTWNSEDAENTFMRAFICPGATRDILSCLQPLVCLDACHSKNRKYPTQIFLATALDGNNQIVILCYAVAPVENTENWTWFLKQLQHAIKGIGCPEIPFISDRQKGLLAGVAAVFPNKFHAACANHLRQNVKTKFGKAADQFFSACVYANTKEM
jgi:hypothetical protein